MIFPVFHKCNFREKISFRFQTVFFGFLSLPFIIFPGLSGFFFLVFWILTQATYLLLLFCLTKKKKKLSSPSEQKLGKEMASSLFFSSLIGGTWEKDLYFNDQ